MIISTQISPIAKRIGYEKASAYLKNAGFDAVDFGISDYGNWNYCARGMGQTVFDKSDEEVCAFFHDIYLTVQKAGLSVGQTHAPFPSSMLDRTHAFLEERNYRLARLAIRITSEMNCGYCVIHPVFCSNYEYDQDLERQKLFHDLNMEFYGNLIFDARKYHVKICLENMWAAVDPKELIPTVCSHAPEFRAWIDELNSVAGEEIFCACLDTGHACITGDSPAETARALGPRLQRLHMHDVRKNADVHTLPFTGICNWYEFAAALREIGYSGTLNFETGGFWDTKPDILLEAATTMLGDTAKYIRTLVEGK